MLASGAVAGDPALPADEDLAFVVVERCTASRLVVGDEAVELFKRGQRLTLGGRLSEPGLRSANEAYAPTGT